ncbi:MAG: D-alanyl-D-alanine carboxypeptidase/D-alanyl-D-alanine-endopeptidase [Flavobacteriales bacterium]|nr:MAG: D-alanyl-D-alanine carboxypeptidase/D-alanyl-D-alanine-endopeptidase [Flavobacteriales bacterium]
MRKFTYYTLFFSFIFLSFSSAQTKKRIGKLGAIYTPNLIKIKKSKDSVQVVEKVLTSKEIVDETIEKIKKDPVLRNAHWGFVVYDPKREKIINSYNEQDAFTPASTTKLLTTETILDLLGKNFVWHTQLEHSGEIDENGVLNGNLYIVGSGDPSLGTGKAGAYKYGEIINDFIYAMTEKGITKVNGDIFIQNAFFKKNKARFLPKNIVWLNTKHYYLPVGSTPIIGNSGEKKTLSRSPFKKQKTFFYISPITNRIVLSNNYQPQEYTTKISVPPYYLANALRKNLIRRKIGVTGKVLAKNADINPEARKKITVYESPRLEDIIFYTNKRSDNALAEALMKASGFYTYGDQTKSSGRQAVVEHLTEEGFHLDGFNYHDGSGLSRKNKVSPIAHAKFLSNLMDEKHFPELFNSLPVGGQSGTLRRMFKTTGNGQVFAKTGTLRGVKTLAGYIKTNKGETLVFSLLINNYRGSVSQVKKKMEKILAPVLDL